MLGPGGPPDFSLQIFLILKSPLNILKKRPRLAKQTNKQTSKHLKGHLSIRKATFALKPVLILSPFPRDPIAGSPQVVPVWPVWPVPPLQTSNKTDKESSHLRVIWNRQWPIQRSVGSVMMTTCLIYLNSSCIPLICFIDSRQLKLKDVIKVNYLWYQGHQPESLLIYFIRGACRFCPNEGGGSLTQFQLF